MSGAWTALGVALLATTVAAAAAIAGDSVAPPGPTPSPETGFRWRHVEVHGRLLVRGVSARQTGAAETDVDAENARLELRWQPSRLLHAVVEYDQAENTHLKDAYVSLRPGRCQLRVGQFKPPVSPIQLASRWELPVSERGLLSDVLVTAFGIAGRRPGVQAAWDPKGRWSLSAGVFRASSVRGDRIGDEAFDNVAADWGALKATSRVAWERKRLALGASFDLRPAEPIPGEGYRRFWTVGTDVAWAGPRRSGPRGWAEAFVGSSWQDANAFDGHDATFLAARVLGGWRVRGRKGRDLYAEPYASLTAFDPDASVREDVLWETAGGVHAGALEHLRVVVEVQHRAVSRNAPLALGLFPSTAVSPGRARTRIVAQVGAAF